MAHRGIAVAVMVRNSYLQWEVLPVTRSQSARRSKLALASRQALLENMGFHPGDPPVDLYLW